MGSALLKVFTSKGLSTSIKVRMNFSQSGVYDEKAFRFLLESESSRSERSGYFYQVLLVYRIDAHGTIAKMDFHVAKLVMETLSRCLRETDYIGWYREGLVAGGILTVVGRDAEMELLSRHQRGLAESLRSELGADEAGCFEIRMFQHDDLAENALGAETMTVN